MVFITAGIMGAYILYRLVLFLIDKKKADSVEKADELLLNLINRGVKKDG